MTDKKTQDQIAAVMLQHGTEDQQRKALEYCGLPEATAPPPVSPSSPSDLLGRMRDFEVDHKPDGWPAVQMRDISALCQMVEGAKRLRINPTRLDWAPGGGYWLDRVHVGALEDAFYLAGK